MSRADGPLGWPIKADIRALVSRTIRTNVGYRLVDFGFEHGGINVGVPGTGGINPIPEPSDALGGRLPEDSRGRFTGGGLGGGDLGGVRVLGDVDCDAVHGSILSLPAFIIA
ncbi:MAG: hypothetical protein AAF663_07810 [Planctomycetota bacterium]